MSTPDRRPMRSKHTRRPRDSHTTCPLPRPPIRSERAATVARWFRLECADPSAATHAIDAPIIDALARLIVPGVIVLLTGPSGAGKSWLLRQIRERLAHRHVTCTDVTGAALPDRPVVDCFDASTSLRDVLRGLSRVGLAEAWTYVRTPTELSEGQRARLRLALALDAAYSQVARSRVLIADEFAAVLDRVTAMIVARSLRRAIDEATTPLSALVATSHDDLVAALEPDVVVQCDFGRTIARWGGIDGGDVWGRSSTRRRR